MYSTTKILRTRTWPCEYLSSGDICRSRRLAESACTQHSRWSCEGGRKAATFRPSLSPDRRPFLDAAALLNSLPFLGLYFHLHRTLVALGNAPTAVDLISTVGSRRVDRSRQDKKKTCHLINYLSSITTLQQL